MFNRLKTWFYKKFIHPKHLYCCPICNGDGIERCNNPDHGFIVAVGGEISRLGCPVCGHDEEHRVQYWSNVTKMYHYGKCDMCLGIGIVNGDQFDYAIDEYGLDVHYNDYTYPKNKYQEMKYLYVNKIPVRGN